MIAVEIRAVATDCGAICNDLLRSLPLWFGIETAILRYVSDAEKMPMLVASDGERCVGFVSLNRHNQWTAEVHVMAIHPDFHRKGIGCRLIEASESYLSGLGHEFLSVKTISPASPNQEYEMTRQFYMAMGFRPVEEFKTLWGAANPCLLMIKSI